jgi:hypothetical protein
MQLMLLFDMTWRGDYAVKPTPPRVRPYTRALHKEGQPFSVRDGQKGVKEDE